MSHFHRWNKVPVIYLTALALFALLLAPNRARAFTFSPMSVSLESTGRGATHSFEVENDSNTKVAIEVSMAHRQFDVNGEEKVTKIADAEKLFLVYPTQLVLGPKEKRTIRVSWAGEKEPKSELAFRIIAEQLPVQTEKPQDQNSNAVIKMLLKYMGSIYITPKGAAPAISARTARRTPKGDLEIELENKGNAHQVLVQARLRLGKLALGSEQVPTLSGLNLLAGSVRKVRLPWPKQLPVSGPFTPVAIETGN